MNSENAALQITLHTTGDLATCEHHTDYQTLQTTNIVNFQPISPDDGVAVATHGCACVRRHVFGSLYQ